MVGMMDTRLAIRRVPKMDNWMDMKLDVEKVVMKDLQKDNLKGTLMV